ncbi:MAG: lysoplasmalogenase [Lachnospiraceae bacterium]|nr:lysoplasmalogenase [Lachnospiraceae bacterium]
MVDRITIILCIIGMIIQCLFIYSEYRKNMVAALLLKGLASIFFVCVGIRGFVRTGGSPFAMKIVYGLVLGALGDIILNIRYLFKKYYTQIFTVGTVSFFAGHIMYLIAQIPLCDRLRASVVSGLIVSGVILVFMDKKLKLSLFYKLGGFLYVCSVVFMASVAVNNYISGQNISRGIYAFGAFFFLSSDVILIFNTFGKRKSFRLSALTLVLYYIGQISIAVSLFFK